MKTSDIILIILALALIVGMLLTALFGRGSRHGYGMVPADQKSSLIYGFSAQPVTFS